MGRKRRQWVPFAYHHITSRGNNRQRIFRDEIDMAEVFRILSMIYAQYKFSICNYCIMTNHYHLLLKSEEVSISKIMALFNKRYTEYHNQKYSHIGHVYQQRFYSSPALTPHDLIEVSKYINRNPINTNPPMVSKMEDYPYSSYQFIKNNQTPPYPFITFEDLPKKIFHPEKKIYLNYCEYVELEEE
ncbi:transposase [Bacillus massilinigeriensis]|uniref:transposase n=1 Tax=Bacillus massilionigeriensis TaxID=1805475 RepID=UPI00096B637E|nr:transposase [Bacillus massilionigeriensis]